MEDFLRFKKMLTPVFIQFLFWLGLLLSLVVGLVFLIAGIARNDGGIAAAGLLYIVLGPIFVRIWCEVLIVVFSINDTLAEIKHILSERGGGQL